MNMAVKRLIPNGVPMQPPTEVSVIAVVEYRGFGYVSGSSEFLTRRYIGCRCFYWHVQKGSKWTCSTPQQLGPEKHL